MEKELAPKKRGRQRDSGRRGGEGKREERSSGVGSREGGHHEETRSLFPGFNFNLSLVLQGSCAICLIIFTPLHSSQMDPPFPLPHPSSSLHSSLKTNKTKQQKPVNSNLNCPCTLICGLALLCGWYTRAHRLKEKQLSLPRSHQFPYCQEL